MRGEYFYLYFEYLVTKKHKKIISWFICKTFSYFHLDCVCSLRFCDESTIHILRSLFNYFTYYKPFSFLHVPHGEWNIDNTISKKRRKKLNKKTNVIYFLGGRKQFLFCLFLFKLILKMLCWHSCHICVTAHTLLL